MLLVNKAKLSLASDRRLVRASDVATVRGAADIIAAAEAEAAEIREAAKREAEAERKRGYEQGLDEGRAEIVDKKLELVDSSVLFMESVEGKMADIVMTALRKCVAEIGDEALVVQIVKKVMEAVIRTQKKVILKVAPEMVSVVRAKLGELTSRYPTVETADVVEDERLKGTACVLETEAGVADASIDTQLAAIERSIRRHLSRSVG
ncbi:MAG: HrpE/YscL family type III secretion apparatus protein [Kiritimatiellae bacterium]|nr:HrpE/YscL family type III secretion apparatus protein [Kiritimatiellia bacterium]